MCREYVQEPLYLLVARWAMQQQRWISSREIADKFNLTPCKAINLVSYILSAVDEIDCQTKTIPNHLEGRGCQCQRMIQVDHIDDQITERIKNAINTDGDDNDSTSMPRMTIPVPPSELNQEQKWKWMMSTGKRQ